MFDSHFEVLLADTPSSIRINYRIRHQVYCLETGYENPDIHRDGLESDAHDENAVHFMVRHKATGKYVAAMRLIIGDLDNLPLTRHSHVQRDLIELPTAPGVEVSRLCVIDEFRRRSPERRDRPPQHVVNINERRREPEILLGLIRAAHFYGLDHGIKYLYFLIAGGLARTLQRLALRVAPIGPECEFHGQRRPYHCDIHTLLDDLPRLSPQIHELFCRAPTYTPFSVWAMESFNAGNGA